MILTNRYLIALGIPFILLLCGALAKKLVRGGGWKRTDFFLGVEFSLAALGSNMVYFYDLQKTGSTTAGSAAVGNNIAAPVSFLAITFFLFLWVVATHQDWEARTQNIKGQFIWLGIICNSIGITLFAGFVLLIRGV